MAQSLLFKLLKKRPKIKKTWQNVYALRQEYNPYQKAWFPIIFYWNRSKIGPAKYRCWVEALATETGDSYYHTEIDRGAYSSRTRPGTDKCNPEHVKSIVAYYQQECDKENPCGPVVEVKKLAVYAPKGYSAV